MHEALDDLDGVHVYVDDILVSGKGKTKEEALEDHDKKIHLLFQRLRE